MQAPHPLGIAIGEVIVDGDDVHALAGQRVEVGSQRRDQRLALAGAHLGDLAIVQDHATNQLDIEMPHAESPLAGLADDGECLRQQSVQRLAVRHPLLEVCRPVTQRAVGQRRDPRLERVDPAHDLHVLLDQPIVAAAENLLE
ncbi:MAG: hypothetical protein AW08_02676 [Candidatus Accumulibacter adjunctus]|uniref:Uncharacterized protein n=1 Tax=Candidatus Accumulibacter adjunctus TaxID=1454001 RepID=A0A011NPC7_9PROT|nr:MAG: hypothetical protein AW08_02676 [Candidatus Accumulibacter adjunctus]